LGALSEDFTGGKCHDYGQRAERFAEVNGIRLRYLIGGKGSPVVLLHGYAEPSHMWHPIMIFRRWSVEISSEYDGSTRYLPVTNATSIDDCANSELKSRSIAFLILLASSLLSQEKHNEMKIIQLLLFRTCF
jgi:hypothetical protein